MLLIEIQNVLENVSEMAPISDYKYKVLVTTVQGTLKTVAEGEIKNHAREEGWRELVQRVIDESVEVG